MMPESAYISALVQGDINNLRSFVCGLIDEFYANHDPRESLDKSFITDLISVVHLKLGDLENILKERCNYAD